VEHLEIEVYIRCDSDPYGLDKMFAHLRIGSETVHREQYYAVDLGRQEAQHTAAP